MLEAAFVIRAQWERNDLKLAELSTRAEVRLAGSQSGLVILVVGFRVVHRGPLVLSDGLGKAQLGDRIFLHLWGALLLLFHPSSSLLAYLTPT